MHAKLVTMLAAAAVAAGAPSAHATPNYHYVGGCSLVVANDRTPNQALGGDESWNGQIVIAVLATNERLGTPAPTATVSVRCDLKIGGSIIQYDALSGSGTGAAVRAGRTQFQSASDDVSVCEEVTVQGEVHPPVCRPAQRPFEDADPAACLAAGAAAPGVRGVVDVGPDGDVTVLGTPWQECPDPR